MEGLGSWMRKIGDMKKLAYSFQAPNPKLWFAIHSPSERCECNRCAIVLHSAKPRSGSRFKTYSDYRQPVLPSDMQQVATATARITTATNDGQTHSQLQPTHREF